MQRIKRLITEAVKNPESTITLKDRLKILFKLDGLTVGAIITADILFLSTLGL